jgi:hypothetical protein
VGIQPPDALPKLLYTHKLFSSSYLLLYVICHPFGLGGDPFAVFLASWLEWKERSKLRDRPEHARSTPGVRSTLGARLEHARSMPGARPAHARRTPGARPMQALSTPGARMKHARSTHEARPDTARRTPGARPEHARCRPHLMCGTWMELSERAYAR